MMTHSEIMFSTEQFWLNNRLHSSIYAKCWNTRR
jgi:hypothetical protein